MIIASREHVVLVRPITRLLAVTVLSFEAQVKKPVEFENEIIEPHISAEEMKLARLLVEHSMTKRLDFATYKDEYTGKVAKLIKAQSAVKKVTGTDIGHDGPPVINLMEALKASINKSKAMAFGSDGSSSRKVQATKAHRTRTRRRTG